MNAPVFLSLPLGVTSACSSNAIGACVGDNATFSIAAQLGFAY
jgi:hypothetical protein